MWILNEKLPFGFFGLSKQDTGASFHVMQHSSHERV